MPSRLTLAAERYAAARLLRLLAVAAIVLPLAVLAGGSLVAWQNKQKEAWDSTARLADLVYEGVSKLFDAQLLVLEQAQALTEGLDATQLAAHQDEVHRRLSAMLAHLPHVRDAFIVGPEGRAVIDGVNFPAPYGNDLTDRDYVQYFRDGGQGLFVSTAGRRKADGLPFFALAIARNPNGPFAGVVATSVAPEYFEGYFRQAARAYGSPDDRAIAIRRADGPMLVRSPARPNQDTTDDAETARRISQSAGDRGRFEIDLPDAGQHRLVAWRRLPAFNMVVLSSLDRASVVRDWAHSIVTQLYFGVPVTLALFVITLLALRRTRQATLAAERAAAEMTRREQAEEAVRQGQKMEALGKLTGGVAHDFNNLLAVILGSAELARRRTPDRVGPLLDNIIHAGHRAATLTRQLLSFSRTQNVDPRVVDLRVALPRMLELLKPSLRGDIALSVDVAADVWPVEIDPGEFEIALLNVAVNARDAMPAGGHFTVAAANRSLDRLEAPGEPALAGDFVVLTLSDTGPGMPPEVAARAFEPFFTTKDVGRGTGLGLSQVYGFARQARGAAAIECQPGAGTRIILFLPRSDRTPDHATKAPDSIEQPGAGLRVLLVEDNADVAGVATAMLHSLGWDVIAVDRARLGLERLDDPFDLLLSDVVMPDGMSGLTLAQTARARQPNLPILLISGYSEAAAAGQTEFPVLRKPFTLEQLAHAVSGVMAGRAAMLATP